MKASQFPKEYRVYDIDEKKMLYAPQLEELGFTLTADGLPHCTQKPMLNVVIQWFSGKQDNNGKKVYEGDVCKVTVSSQIGNYIDYAIMRWVNDAGMFLLMLPNTIGGNQVEITHAEVIGSDVLNPELLAVVNESK